MGNAIVTGAFGVLGRATVAELKARGHKVAAVDMSPAHGNPVADLTCEAVDLLNADAVAEAYASVVDKLGSIDALVNVAGGFIWEPVEGGTVESWDSMYRTNLQTAFLSSRAALPELVRSRGSIVNIGAAAANQPAAGMAPYAASKAGIRALTESLADELRESGVRVNAVLPTIIDTPRNRTDMPDADTSIWVKPESAARVIAFLVSSDAASITGAALPLSLAG